MTEMAPTSRVAFAEAGKFSRVIPRNETSSAHAARIPPQTWNAFTAGKLPEGISLPRNHMTLRFGRHLPSGDADASGQRPPRPGAPLRRAPGLPGVRAGGGAAPRADAATRGRGGPRRLRPL